MNLCVSFNIECAHSIEQPIGVPILHGHSYMVEICVPSSAEFPVPLPQIQGWAELVKHRLDHTNLNDVLDDAPTMEAIVRFVRRKWLGPDPVRVKVWRPTLGVGAEWVKR